MENIATQFRRKPKHKLAGATAYLVQPVEYRAWCGMLQRCRNPKNKHWRHYGGRGIEVRFTSLEEFFAEAGPRPSPDHSIDRIDNDGHYEPGNVKWSTAKEQRANQRKRLPRSLGDRCRHGHKLTELNSYIDKKSVRVCYECIDHGLAENRINRAAQRYIKRFGGIVFLGRVPPLIPHDYLPREGFRRRPAGYFKNPKALKKGK